MNVVSASGCPTPRNRSQSRPRRPQPSLKCRRLSLRSLKIMDAKLRKDHPHVAMYLGNLAGLYASMGYQVEQKPSLSKSLARDHTSG